MLMEKERELVVEYGKKLILEGLTSGTGGNISVADRKNRIFAISPSGINYFDTKPVDIVVMDFEGNIIDGNRKPSSEADMHRLIYREYKDASAIVHCHSTFATAYSTFRKDLKASSYVVADAGGKDIRCAKYACFGSREIAEETVKALKGRKAAFQANHGQVAYGKTILEAFKLAVSVEWVTKIHMTALSCGNPVIISDLEMEKVSEKFNSYGQK